MCGIVVTVRKGNSDPAPGIERAMSLLRHRGPDDSGVWTGSASMHGNPFAIGMGHVRLSIIDLSAAGRQPMDDGHGNVIVYNGEIYNYLELRQELKALGHEFRTGSDTEVVLAAFRQWGTDCLSRFIGMWAFVIWDGSRLFVSRDRLGKKPLYYFSDDETGLLAFASELKGFREMQGVTWGPDEKTVYHYLSFAEIEGGGSTFFEGIREFPAASYLLHAPGEPMGEAVRFWSLPTGTRDVDEQEAVMTTADLLRDSVRLRLRSDAPLGLSLSGGLDSTLLLALVNESGLDRPPVFSSMYSQAGYNEKEYFDVAAGLLGCDPHLAETTPAQFRQDFERLVYHLDQPSKLPGPFSLWRVSALAGDNVRVLIDGQGPDEVAGGYMYFIPASFREASLMEKVLGMPDLAATAWANRHILDQYPLHLIWERISGRAGTNRRIPLRREWAAGFVDERPLWAVPSDLNSTLRRAVTESSLPALLRYGDRANMAFGIENRCPYLDHRLVEYVTALPRKMKIRGGTTKWIFRAVAANRIPDKILGRRIKLGFPTPVGEWYRDILLEDTKARLGEYERLPLFRKWVDTGALSTALQEHASHRADHQALLWRILSTGAWIKTQGLT